MLLSESDPIPGLEWAEVLATSDLPGGVVNLLSGPRSETLPHLARHMDANALALAGLPKEVDHNTDLERLDLIRAFTETKTTWHPVGW